MATALVALTPEGADAVDGLVPLYDPAMMFRDPIQRIRGRERKKQVRRGSGYWHYPDGGLVAKRE